MSAPRHKKVTSEVFERIALALDEMASDDQAKRTKREIERRSNLSHDAVDRAFRQDNETGTQWHINRQFAVLKEGRTTRVSPDRHREMEIEEVLAEMKETIKNEKRLNERYMMALFALHLDAAERDTDQQGDVIPMGRNRRPNRWT